MRARYDAQLPPIISIVRCPGRPVISVPELCLLATRPRCHEAHATGVVLSRHESLLLLLSAGCEPPQFQGKSSRREKVIFGAPFRIQGPFSTTLRLLGHFRSNSQNCISRPEPCKALVLRATPRISVRPHREVSFQPLARTPLCL